MSIGGDDGSPLSPDLSQEGEDGEFLPGTEEGWTE